MWILALYHILNSLVHSWWRCWVWMENNNRTQCEIRWRDQMTILDQVKSIFRFNSALISYFNEFMDIYHIDRSEMEMGWREREFVSKVFHGREWRIITETWTRIAMWIEYHFTRAEINVLWTDHLSGMEIENW